MVILVLGQDLASASFSSVKFTHLTLTTFETNGKTGRLGSQLAMLIET